MIIQGIPTRRINQGDDLFTVFSESYSEKIPENSLLVITSKIVSLAENSVREFFSEEDFFEIVASESDTIVSKKEKFWLTEKNGLLLPNAGIDRSNAPPNTAILLPRNSQQFAIEFRKKLQKKYGISNCGVLIVDSRVVSRRCGISGIALGWSGFRGVTDERGKKDIFEKELTVSYIAVADNIASFAQIFFGQSNEQIPFVLLKQCDDIVFTEETENPKIALISAEDDIFSDETF